MQETGYRSRKVANCEWREVLTQWCVWCWKSWVAKPHRISGGKEESEEIVTTKTGEMHRDGEEGWEVLNE